MGPQARLPRLSAAQLPRALPGGLAVAVAPARSPLSGVLTLAARYAPS
jgi:hypothetical protein